MTGVVCHTDQGGEYTGEMFKRACTAAGDAAEGPDRVGPGYAVAESFNSTLEFELLSQEYFSTREQARRRSPGGSTTMVRRHSTDEMLSPVEFERRQAAAAREVAA